VKGRKLSERTCRGEILPMREKEHNPRLEANEKKTKYYVEGKKNH